MAATKKQKRRKPKLSVDDRAARRKQMAAEVKAADYARRPEALAAVARKYGVSIPLVRRSCEEFQVRVPKKPTGGFVHTGILPVIAELRKGKQQTDVARKFNLTKQRVQQIHAAAVRAGLLEKRK